MLSELRPGLAGVELDSTIFRPATFIEMSINNLTHAMWLGCGLVIVVLAFFLHDWRTAFIRITAIPLSLVIAAMVLHWRGETLNVMVLAGLVIALGEVVDDAIIDVENILRRLRQNRALAEPRGRRGVRRARRPTPYFPLKYFAQQPFEKSHASASFFSKQAPEKRSVIVQTHWSLVSPNELVVHSQCALFEA